MTQIIDGKKISAEIKDELKEKVAALKAEGKEITLAVIQVGNDPASTVYVGNKKKSCAYIGIHSLAYELPEDTTEGELLSLVEQLNESKDVHGILVQLPLPKHINEDKIIKAISPKKDVDAFHEQNVGKIMIGNYSFLPCTPAGIVELIDSIGVDVTGKECVVIGRSNIVGKPMAMLMLHKNATVTICHSRTKNLPEVCRRADILIAAVGIAKFVKADMVKPGAIVIDVGMDRDENGKLCGDVDFENVKEVAGYLTPVPGGVGPMTISMLMKNTLTAAKERAARK